MAGMYRKIREAERKDQAWELYLKQFHFMITGNIKYEAFNDYYDRVSGHNIDLRSDAEILAEVEDIRKYIN